MNQHNSTCSKCGQRKTRVRFCENQNYWRRLPDGTKEPRKGESEYVHAYRCACPKPKGLEFAA